MALLTRLLAITAVLLSAGCRKTDSETKPNTKMNFYQVDSVDLWGDYGHILVNGMTRHLPQENGQLQLERAGPFMPPITFPGTDLVVTTEFKEKLQASELGTFEFRPVVKARIVDIPWESFDRTSEKPEFYPATFEPEDYILGRPHSEVTADAMGDIWQVVPRDGAVVDTDIQRKPWDYDIRVHTDTWNGDHLFHGSYGKKGKPRYSCWFIVTESGKEWLEKNVGDWVTFKALPVK